MDLHNLTGRKWYIEVACATIGEEIFESIHEMAKMVKDYKSYSLRTFPEFDQILWTVTGPLFHPGQNSSYTSTVE